MNKNKKQLQNKKTLTLKLQTIRQLDDTELRVIAGGYGGGSTNPNTGCCTNHPN